MKMVVQRPPQYSVVQTPDPEEVDAFVHASEEKVMEPVTPISTLERKVQNFGLLTP